MNAASQLPVIGMDIAKNVFQLHFVEGKVRPERSNAASSSGK
jgi:hypothetical protein